MRKLLIAATMAATMATQAQAADRCFNIADIHAMVAAKHHQVGIMTLTGPTALAAFEPGRVGVAVVVLQLMGQSRWAVGLVQDEMATACAFREIGATEYFAAMALYGAKGV